MWLFYFIVVYIGKICLDGCICRLVLFLYTFKDALLL